MAAAEDPQRRQLKLTLDVKQKRLVYAECHRCLADALFSFLTTPVAALVRRTGNSSGLPCMDSLYKSVEDMPASYFETPKCRDLLLLPQSAFGFALHRLKIRVNDVEEGYYMCPSVNCSKCSLFYGVKCDCGQSFTKLSSYSLPPPGDCDAVFIPHDLEFDFLVTDDLFISPSTPEIRSCIRTLTRVATPQDLQQHIVFVDNDRIVQLMKLSLLSNTPLTDAFLSKAFATEPVLWPVKLWKPSPTIEEDCILGFYRKLYRYFEGLFTKKMAITLFHDQDRVVYAIADERFVDLLLSFLTLPFGTIISALDGSLSLKCLSNLHKAAKMFRSDNLFYMHKWQPYKFADTILDPAVALYHTSQNQPLKIGKRPFTLRWRKCDFCDANGYRFLRYHKGHYQHSLKPINPKFYGNKRTKEGGGYMRPQENFVITSDLLVKPNYDITEIIQEASLVEKTVLVGREEALELLMASLVSKDPLTMVFLQAGVNYNKKDV